MALPLQERRRRDRERKAAERAEMNALGVPSADVVNRAMVEALSFSMTSANKDRKSNERPHTAIEMSSVVWTALRILCVRGGYDLKASRAALLQALAARDEHRWPSHVPSLAAPTRGSDPLVTMLASLDLSAKD